MLYICLDIMLRSLMFSLPDCCKLHVVHINWFSLYIPFRKYSVSWFCIAAFNSVLWIFKDCTDRYSTEARCYNSCSKFHCLAPYLPVLPLGQLFSFQVPVVYLNLCIYYSIYTAIRQQFFAYISPKAANFVVLHAYTRLYVLFFVRLYDFFRFSWLWHGYMLK